MLGDGPCHFLQVNQLILLNLLIYLLLFYLFYFRGRPNEAREEDVYICEHRVDKTARLFNKISKHKHPTCTKFYTFTEFDLKLKLMRSYTVG